MATVTDSTAYNLRPTTVAAAASGGFATPPRTGRKRLSLSHTATLVRTPEHDCYTVKPEHVEIKVIQRIWHSYYRFQVAFQFNCKTWRGTTRLNGSVSSCDCQSAHASLSPTLYDDKLQRILDVLAKKELLSPVSRRYVIQRFDVESPTKLDPEEAVRKLKRSEIKGSFAGSDLAAERNATYENPRGSNRLDMHLEYHLRPLEDQLADLCSDQRMKPVEATEKLVHDHMQLLLTAKRNISDRQLDFELFVLTYDELRELREKLESRKDQATYETFIFKAQKILEIKKRLYAEHPGAPHLNQFLKSFVSFYMLQQLVSIKDLPFEEQYSKFEAVKSLVVVKKIDADKTAADLQVRLDEASYQLGSLLEIQQQIPQFDKAYFGSVDEGGVRHTPTKHQIAKQLVKAMKKDPPTG